MLEHYFKHGVQRKAEERRSRRVLLSAAVRLAAKTVSKCGGAAKTRAIVGRRPARAGSGLGRIYDRRRQAGRETEHRHIILQRTRTALDVIFGPGRSELPPRQ